MSSTMSEDTDNTPVAGDLDITPSPSQEEVVPESVDETTPAEEDVSKLDLTEPEHLKTFRTSYERRVAELAERDTRIQALEAENNELRESATRGVYFNTEVPLEDFNPAEGLARMKEEEPEYFERVKESIFSEHFWPSVPEQIQAIDRPLDRNDPADKVIEDKMLETFDLLAQRGVGVPGPIIFGIMSILNDPQNEYILHEIRARAQNQPPSGFENRPTTTTDRATSPYTTTGAHQWQQGQFPAPIPVQTVEQIARQYQLDPSEEGQLKVIKQMQLEQQEKYDAQMSAYRREQASQAVITQLQEQLNSLKKDQQTRQTVSEDELQKKAEQRLTEQIGTVLKTEIQTRYGNAVTDTNRHLLSKLETLTEQRLLKDPTYQQAKTTAVKWFKQSAKATNGSDRDKWDAKGLAALSVMVPIRLKAIEIEATELLGPIKRRVETKRTAPAPKAREIEGGRHAPPRTDAAPAQSGDIATAKSNILKRAEQSGLLANLGRR